MRVWVQSCEQDASLSLMLPGRAPLAILPDNALSRVNAINSRTFLMAVSAEPGLPDINIKTSLLIGLLIGSTQLYAAEPIIERISIDGLSGWQEHSFKGHTNYQLVEEDGKQSIKAVSMGSASGLVKKVSINLDKTPYLYWRWRVDGVLQSPNERSKQGDDYPARIYVVKEGGWAPWRTRSINYVWSSSQAEGSVWPSAYTEQSMMVAVRSGVSDGPLWKTERRNLKKDFKRLFDQDVHQVDLVAIMTDTDNTGAKATAWYGDIYLSSE